MGLDVLLWVVKLPWRFLVWDRKAASASSWWIHFQPQWQQSMWLSNSKLGWNGSLCLFEVAFLVGLSFGNWLWLLGTYIGKHQHTHSSPFPNLFIIKYCAMTGRFMTVWQAAGTQLSQPPATNNMISDALCLRWREQRQSLLWHLGINLDSRIAGKNSLSKCTRNWLLNKHLITQGHHQAQQGCFEQFKAESFKGASKETPHS